MVAVVFALMLALTVVMSARLSSLMLTCAFLLATFGGLGVYYIGVSRRKPVALRMDDHGLSGYYTQPLLWQDVAKMGPVKLANGDVMMGIRLADPIAHRALQSPWHRLLSTLNGRKGGYHIKIPPTILKGADMRDLLAEATARHAKALDQKA